MSSCAVIRRHLLSMQFRQRLLSSSSSTMTGDEDGAVVDKNGRSHRLCSWLSPSKSKNRHFQNQEKRQQRTIYNHSSAQSMDFIKTNKNNIMSRSFSSDGRQEDIETINYDDDKNLQEMIQKFGNMTPHPVSLQDIMEAHKKYSLKQANAFLRKEYSIRCAERILMLQERIPDFQKIPELKQAYDQHIQGFIEMRNYDPALDATTPTNDYIPVVRSIVDRCQDTIPLLCLGMSRLVRQCELQQDSSGSSSSDSSDSDSDSDSDDNYDYCKTCIRIDEAYTNKFLNEFLLNRIGSNVLMSQYLASMTGDGPTSIIDPNCNPVAICRETARGIQNLCLQETGYRPRIQIIEKSSSGADGSTVFPFMPGGLKYILQELLKNSAVATAKKKKKQSSTRRSNMVAPRRPSAMGNSVDDDDTITVVVCSDERRVMIHIGDHAGGIPFDVGQHIWSYLYTTKKQQENDRNKTEATDLGGFGVGLPLSRLYANYLGGSINLVSLPGYGTHAYVYLPRLPKYMIEIVPVRSPKENTNTRWWDEIAANRTNGEFIL